MSGDSSFRPDEPDGDPAGEDARGRREGADEDARRDGDAGRDENAGRGEDAPSAGGSGDEPGTHGGPRGEGFRSREVVVPVRLYKTVTVFSTLFSAVLVVAGFVLLDAATDRGRAPLAEVDAAVAAAGLACIVGGGLVYAFSSRFRTAGMGKDKDDADEQSDDG